MHGTDPAFPSFDISASAGDGSTHYRVAPGITVRDYFAGMCMAGFSANQEFMNAKPEKIAAMAYEQADAMILERAKGTP